MAVTFTRSADAHHLLRDLYADAGDRPRLLAAAFPGLPGDPATPAGRDAVARHLHRPTAHPEPDQRFTSRAALDAALGRPTTPPQAHHPQPIGVLTLSPSGSDDLLADLTDTEWARVTRRILNDLGEPYWPRHHPWMVVRRGNEVQLVTNTVLPHGDLEDQRPYATALLHLERTQKALLRQDEMLPALHADDTRVVFRQADDDVLVAFGGDTFAGDLIRRAGLRPVLGDDVVRHRTLLGDDAETAEHAARWAAELLHLAGYHFDVPAGLGGHPAVRSHTPAHIPAAARVRALADVIATTDDPDQVSMVLGQILDPEHGVLAQAAAVLDAATRWQEAHEGALTSARRLRAGHARSALGKFLTPPSTPAKPPSPPGTRAPRSR